MFNKVSLERRVLSLAGRAKHGIFSFGEAKSWRLCSEGTLRVTLARMARKGSVARLAQGLYFARPIEQPGALPDDVFYAAQLAFGGYLAFATALYLHRLVGEYPFTVFVATGNKSVSTQWGAVEVKAVALRSRAVGVIRMGDYVVSTRAKTLYDCLHLPEYAGGVKGVVNAFKNARLSEGEWMEFWRYVGSFEEGGGVFRLRLRQVLLAAGFGKELRKNVG